MRLRASRTARKNLPTNGGVKVAHNGSTEPLNQTGLEPQVKTRPRRNVGHPSTLHDYYVEPVLKLTRKVKQKPPRRRPLIMYASGTPPVTRREHMVAKRTKNTKRRKELEKDFEVRLGRESSNVEGQFPQSDQKQNILTWMVDSGVIPEGAKLYHWKSIQNEVYNGEITSNGVACTDCIETMNISRFMCHVGDDVVWFNHLLLRPGFSLLDCLMQSWRIEESNIIGFNFIDPTSDISNDDICDICGDDGHLVCCESCPATFHPSCLKVKKLHSEGWHCVYCLCKFCSRTKCRGFICDQLFSCALCDEKFHKPCGQVGGLNVESGGLSFCGIICREIYERLHAALGIKMEAGEGFSFTLLKRLDVSQDIEITNAKKIECNCKLAVALSVMDECFHPIIDNRSGVDVIRNIVYNCGSNFKRLNYGGFFTAIIEKNDEVISVAPIRVHGNLLAEMPFIGTREIYRWQGMCRRLLDSIESILSSLGVRELVIPAIPHRLEMWTNVFGFKALEESTKKNMKTMCMVDFPDTTTLQKHIPNRPIRKLGRVAGRLM